MKFRIKVADDSGDGWWEEYDKPVSNLDQWAKDTIASFNRTLQPGEKKRTLLTVEVLDAASRAEHTWEKQNIYTVVKGNAVYDVMKCSSCGITAKRHGVSEGIRLDCEFARAKVYRRCDTAYRHLKVKEERAIALERSVR